MGEAKNSFICLIKDRCHSTLFRLTTIIRGFLTPIPCKFYSAGFQLEFCLLRTTPLPLRFGISTPLSLHRFLLSTSELSPLHFRSSAPLSEDESGPGFPASVRVDGKCRSTRPPKVRRRRKQRHRPQEALQPLQRSGAGSQASAAAASASDRRSSGGSRRKKTAPRRLPIQFHIFRRRLAPAQLRLQPFLQS